MQDQEKLKLKSLLTGIQTDLLGGTEKSLRQGYLSLSNAIADLKSGRFPDAGRAADILLENLDADDSAHFRKLEPGNFPELVCLYERILRGAIEKLRAGFTAQGVLTLESLAELMLIAMDELTENEKVSQTVGLQRITPENGDDYEDETQENS